MAFEIKSYQKFDNYRCMSRAESEVLLLAQQVNTSVCLNFIHIKMK